MPQSDGILLSFLSSLEPRERHARGGGPQKPAFDAQLPPAFLHGLVDAPTSFCGHVRSMWR